MKSPYLNKPLEEWKNITNNLVDNYPLKMEEILDISLLSWSRLWSSVIGEQIPLTEVNLPATVVGYFFQKLFSFELSKRYPNDWRGEIYKEDKDLVNLNNATFSTEMKSSGQLGLSLYGNRSYNQALENSYLGTKDKSGYYITLNFYDKLITSIRFGWIDQDDWIPQSSQTGQAATLRPEVYQYKLIEIRGDYIKSRPIELFNGVGPKLASQLRDIGISTLDDLKRYQGNDKKVLKIINSNIEIINSY